MNICMAHSPLEAHSGHRLGIAHETSEKRLLVPSHRARRSTIQSIQLRLQRLRIGILHSARLQSVGLHGHRQARNQRRPYFLRRGPMSRNGQRSALQIQRARFGQQAEAVALLHPPRRLSPSQRRGALPQLDAEDVEQRNPSQVPQLPRGRGGGGDRRRGGGLQLGPPGHAISIVGGRCGLRMDVVVVAVERDPN